MNISPEVFFVKNDTSNVPSFSRRTACSNVSAGHKSGETRRSDISLPR